MKKLYYFITLLFLLGFSNFAEAQGTDEQLAAHYFNKGDFEKAAIYYDKLYNDHYMPFYYSQLYRSYLELNNYKDGEKLVRKHFKKNPTNLELFVDLGIIHRRQGNEEKAISEFEKSIKHLSPNQSQIVRLANSFNRISEEDYAFEVYKRGQKLLKGYYDFRLEIAAIYGSKGNNEEMFKLYLDYLSDNPRHLPNIQSSLNRGINLIEEDDKADLLKRELIRRIQKNPNKRVFTDMLIWLFIQRKDFDGAYVHSKAIDKRENEGGSRLMKLADLSKSNGNFRLAKKCYEYVILQGGNGNYKVNYRVSKMKLLQVSTEQLIRGDYTQTDLIQLDDIYRTTINELGKRSTTVLLMKEWGHLKAFYLHDIQTAIPILEETIKIPGISKLNQAQSKLELADILLFNGDIWDASLYYQQVDKAFKHDVIGHEAKFRAAKISFYTGDFDWAQTQLNVLKGSTSKLIANDAMRLSLIITDNFNLDTTKRPMLMYANADLLTFQNKLDEAINTLDSIKRIYPNHTLKDEILFQKYLIYKKKRNYPAAAENLQNIVDNHIDDILGDDALFNLADLYESNLSDPEKAKDLYEKLILEFPGSYYIAEARKRFRKLRGDQLN